VILCSSFPGFLLVRKMFSDFMVGTARGGLRGRLFNVSAHFGMVSWQVPDRIINTTHHHLDMQTRWCRTGVAL